MAPIGRRNGWTSANNGMDAHEMTHPTDHKNPGRVPGANDMTEWSPAMEITIEHHTDQDNEVAYLSPDGRLYVSPSVEIVHVGSKEAFAEQVAQARLDEHEEGSDYVFFCPGDTIRITL